MSKDGAPQQKHQHQCNCSMVILRAASFKRLKQRGTDRCLALWYNSVFLEWRVALKTRPDSPDPICFGGSTPISHDSDMHACLPSPPLSSLYKCLLPLIIIIICHSFSAQLILVILTIDCTNCSYVFSKYFCFAN